MQDYELSSEKQPDAVSDQIPAVAPSLSLYVSLIVLAVLLIVISFQMRVDWPALFLNLAASLIAAVVLLVFVDRRLRASEVGQIQRFPREMGLRSLLLVSQRHRHLHAYTRAFLSVLEPKLQSKVVPNSLQELARKAQESFVLVGLPGTGKTTRLQMLAALLGREFLKHRLTKAPILFPLRLWLTGESLQEALYKHIEGFAAIRRRSIRQTLQQGRAIVMFDGADEISMEQMTSFSREFAGLREAYPAVIWIVSTRPGILPEVGDLPKVTLPALTSDEMRSLRQRNR